MALENAIHGSNPVESRNSLGIQATRSPLLSTQPVMLSAAIPTP